jgi:hypothetical protein
LKSRKIGEHVWASRNLRRKENMARAQDLAAGADHTDQSFGVTICIYVAIALER